VKVLEDWKIQVAVLWLIDTGAALIAGVGALLEPNAIQQLLATGEFQGSLMSPEFLLLLAILLWVPFVMAFLSVTLKNPTNRWANIIVGIVWLALGFSNAPNLIANPTAYAILLWLTEDVAKVLIIWIAWKSKQKT
jgi:hypothetical protein